MTLTANGKIIPTQPIKWLLTCGERNADQIVIDVPQSNNGTDVSRCTFFMRARNETGDIITQQLTSARAPGDRMLLTWTVNDLMTAVPGMLSLELVGSVSGSVVIKYDLDPIFVRQSVPESGSTPLLPPSEQTLQLLEQYAASAREAVEDAEQKASETAERIASQKVQTIVDDVAAIAVESVQEALKTIVDETLTQSGKAADAKAAGDKLTSLAMTQTVIKGILEINAGGVSALKTLIYRMKDALALSEDGKIPELEVALSRANSALDAITTLSNRATSLEAAEDWGDWVPQGETGVKYCECKLVEVQGKHTFRVLPTISQASGNALSMIPSGLFVPDLSGDVTAHAAHLKSVDAMLTQHTQDIESVRNSTVPADVFNSTVTKLQGADSRAAATIGDTDAYNRLKLQSKSGTNNGVTWTVNAEDGTITLNGTATAVFVIRMQNESTGVTRLRPGKYWFDYGNTAFSRGQVVFRKTESGAVKEHLILSDFASQGGFAFEVTEELYTLCDAGITARFNIGSGGNYDTVTFKPMIVPIELRGASFVPYQPTMSERLEALEALLTPSAAMLDEAGGDL